MSTPQPVLFHYTLSQLTHCNLSDQSIRIDWISPDGIPRSASGNWDDTEVTWLLGSPVPRALSLAARDCCYEDHVPCCAFAGQESRSKQDDEVARQCLCCGKREATWEDLSEQGECTRCYVERMSRPNEKTESALEKLRSVGAL